MDLLRLRNIANFLAFEKDLYKAMQYIGLTACQSNQPCRIYTARLTVDSTLHHVASFGYQSEFINSFDHFDLVKHPVLSDAIQNNSVLIQKRDSNYLKMYEAASQLENNSDWKTTIFLPLLPDFAASITMRAEVDTNEENVGYFEMLRAILNLYIHHLNFEGKPKSQIEARNRDSLVGESLTTRQTEILEMIRQGLTNNAIAVRLGYSESLIRQETISIYQKLGVDGRRELMNGQSI